MARTAMKQKQQKKANMSFFFRNFAPQNCN